MSASGPVVAFDVCFAKGAFFRLCIDAVKDMHPRLYLHIRKGGIIISERTDEELATTELVIMNNAKSNVFEFFEVDRNHCVYVDTIELHRVLKKVPKNRCMIMRQCEDDQRRLTFLHYFASKRQDSEPIQFETLELVKAKSVLQSLDLDMSRYKFLLKVRSCLLSTMILVSSMFNNTTTYITIDERCVLRMVSYGVEGVSDIEIPSSKYKQNNEPGHSESVPVAAAAVVDDTQTPATEIESVSLPISIRSLLMTTKALHMSRYCVVGISEQCGLLIMIPTPNNECVVRFRLKENPRPSVPNHCIDIIRMNENFQ